jgi:hypothetical protein
MTRDAFDYLGNVVAQISEPEGVTWSEERWEKELAFFSKPPPTIEEIQAMDDLYSVEDRQKFLVDLLKRTRVKFKSEGINGMQAMWTFHQARKLSFRWQGVDWVISTFDLYASGNVELLVIAMAYTKPDDFTLPYHWWTRERLDWVRDECKSFLGWA